MVLCVSGVWGIEAREGTSLSDRLRGFANREQQAPASSFFSSFLLSLLSGYCRESAGFAYPALLPLINAGGGASCPGTTAKILHPLEGWLARFLCVPDSPGKQLSIKYSDSNTGTMQFG